MKWPLLLIAILVILILVAVLGPRAPRAEFRFVPPPDLPDDPRGVEKWVAEREAKVPGIRPGLAKAIEWADPIQKTKSKIALVFVHGFGASRGEVAPTIERVGQRLNANVFFTRLTGHGRDKEAFRGVRLEDWYSDLNEALAVGRRLGDRVWLVGMSTGAALAAAAAPLLSAYPLGGMVFLSPNFGVTADPPERLLWPWGTLLARLIVGEYRDGKPQNELQEHVWTRYQPSASLVTMASAVRAGREADLEKVAAPVACVYTASDETVLVDRIKTNCARFPKGKLVEVASRHHVLAGDAVCPEGTGPVSDAVVAFIRENDK